MGTYSSARLLVLLAAAATCTASTIRTTTKSPARGIAVGDEEVEEGSRMLGGLGNRNNDGGRDEDTKIHGPSWNGTADSDDRIIGGFLSQYDSWYPFNARLFGQFEQGGQFYAFCGGTVISSVWVLTAAHCVINRDGGDSAVGLAVRVGSRFSNSGGQYRTVRQWIYHGNFGGFGSGRYGNDVALLRLTSPVTLNGNVQPALVEGPGVTQWVGRQLVGCGWGAVSTDQNQGSSNQMKAFFPYVSSCRDGPNNVPSDAFFCAFGRDAGPSRTCNGDSGGYIGWYSSRDQRWVVSGASSFHLDLDPLLSVDTCVNNGFASVSFYNAWIYYVADRYY